VTGAGKDRMRSARDAPSLRGVTTSWRVPLSPQVETRREATRPPFQEDHRLISFRLVQRLMESAQHWDGEDIDLAVVHDDGAD